MSGEGFTTEQLAVELDWFCGCGNPEAAAKTLLDLLDLFPLYSNREAFEAMVPTNGLQYLLLYALDSLGAKGVNGRPDWWMEHGGGIGGSWLAPRGEAIREALRREWESDKFESLFDDRCVHGYLFDSDHDCAATPNPPTGEEGQ